MEEKKEISLEFFNIILQSNSLTHNFKLALLLIASSIIPMQRFSAFQTICVVFHVFVSIHTQHTTQQHTAQPPHNLAITQLSRLTTRMRQIQ